MTRRLPLVWAPLAAAGVLAFALGLGGVQTGLLLGVAAFAGLALARRPLSLMLAAWALAGATAFGLSAGVLAGLLGLSVRAMLAAGTRHWAGNTLAVVAIALATLGILVATVAMIAHRGDEER